MAENAVAPHLFAIVGATGDLAERKLLPALFHLTREGHLEKRHAVLGLARDTEMDDDGFRRWAREALQAAGFEPDAIARWCDRCLYYQPIGEGGPEDYRSVAERVEALEETHDLPGNRVFYLAIPPGAFPVAIRGLGEVGLNRGPGWTRLVIEKPFGRDLESARELNELVHRYFEETQLYRIDHYLGKETVQNLLVFRFANALFESVWNRDRVESVQITVAESLGIEDRAGYYDRAGALRDMVQNHLTQLISLVGMETPAAFDANDVRYEKVKLLRAIRPIEPGDVVLGQYAAGTIGGRDVVGYLEEPDVPEDSRTETFVAIKLGIDTWRWQGVPFYVRTGKRLKERITQIAVAFREPPVCLFESVDGCEMHPNVLHLTLQPDEGFDLCIEVKAPGEPFTLRTLPLHFRYREAFGSVPDAYETLLLDILTGDQTLFVRADETEAAWELYTPLLERELPVELYPAGSWGPEEADRLLERAGHRWHAPIRVSAHHAIAEAAGS